MIAVRGTFDGKTFRVAPTEILPEVEGETPVAIIFLNTFLEDEHQQAMQVKAAQWMRARRAQMDPLDISIRELIEEGREQ